MNIRIELDANDITRIIAEHFGVKEMEVSIDAGPPLSPAEAFENERCYEVYAKVTAQNAPLHNLRHICQEVPF